MASRLVIEDPYDPDWLKRELWGKTRIGPTPVDIFKSTGKGIRGSLALTGWHRGRCAIDIKPRVFDDRRKLVSTLFHEFTHVIEGVSDEDRDLVLTGIPECTPLARTMEWGMVQLWGNLEAPIKPFRF